MTNFWLMNFSVFIAGFGISWTLPAGTVVVNSWFQRYQMVTNQAPEMARALYVIIMPYFVQLMIENENLGWRWAIRILALFAILAYGLISKILPRWIFMARKTKSSEKVPQVATNLELTMSKIFLNVFTKSTK